MIDAFAFTVFVVPNQANFAIHKVLTLADAGRPVELKPEIASTIASAVLYCCVPDLIKVTGVRNYFAGTVSVVNVVVAVGALFGGA